MKKDLRLPLFKLLALTLLIGTKLSLVSAQSLRHPHIWMYNEDRQEILNNIEQYVWAKNLFNQIKTRVDRHKNTHKYNPRTFLMSIPQIPGEYATRSAHTNCAAIASEAAMLYYLTNDEDYAQLAADVLSHYCQRIVVQDGGRLPKNTGLFFDEWWRESRVMFPKIPVIYDLIYDFVNDDSTTVYDFKTQSRKRFNNSEAQETVKKLSDIILKSITAMNCNHSVLAGNGALFNLMMIDDDATREQYFTRYFYYPNNDRFDAFQWTLDEFTDQNIWNETFGYSKATHQIVIQTLNVLDRFKPELNILNENIRIFEGFPLYENYFYPSGAVLRFGDTGTGLDIIPGYQWILKTATRKNWPEYIKSSSEALRFEYAEMGGYNPTITTDALEWRSPLQLLWGVNVADTIPVIEPRVETNLHVPDVGIVIQRNFNATDKKLDGLMCYSGGTTYVHAHSSGIDLELYGKGYILGAESGSGAYGSDEHEDYRVRHAAHNTVIVNASGKRESGWNNRMAKTQVLASEPSSKEVPISNNFSFVTQYIDDNYNDCKQQRNVGIIRTSETSGYYFDLFRSKGNSKNDFHDYIYHNIGDDVRLEFKDKSPLSLSPSDKYKNDIANSVTGWKYFESVNSSSATNHAVEAIFTASAINRKMHVFFPAGVEHEYATALAPTTKGAKGAYDKKKTPLVTLRKYGEAWKEAFVAIYEPAYNESGSDKSSQSSSATVKSVDNLYTGNSIVGAKVVSEVDGKTITDFIICNEGDDRSFYINDPEIEFKGRFGVARIIEMGDSTDLSLYIGVGDSLAVGDIVLNANERKKGVLYKKNVENVGVTSSNNIKLNPNDQTLKIFPNPCSGAFTIQFEKDAQYQIQIYGLDGQIMFQHTMQGNSIRLNNDNRFSKGLCFIVATDDDNNRFSNKLLISE